MNVLAWFISMTLILTTGCLLQNTKGKQFMIGFMENPKYSQSMNPAIFLVSASFNNVQVYINSTMVNSTLHNITLPSRSVHHIHFTDTYRHIGTGLADKGIYIEASDEITTFALNQQNLSPSVFLAMPIRCLGKSYYALTLYPPAKKCQLLITAVYDNTDIEITLAKGLNAGIVEFESKPYAQGEKIQQVMKSFQTLQLQSLGDLTGTAIMSTKPLSIFSGNIKTNVLGTNSNSDHLAIQLPPIQAWGRFFIVIANPFTKMIGYIKFVSGYNETNITCHCASNVSEILQTFVLSDAGESVFTQQAQESCYLWANKPILLAQVTSEKNPSLIVVTPIEQYLKEYTFTRPYLLPKGFKHILSLVVHENATSDLLLNGSPLSSSITYSRIQETSFVVTSVQLYDDYQNLTIASKRNTFWAVLQGSKTYETYAVNTGMGCCTINTQQTMFPGDGIDNDCDGYVDEEECNNNEDDDEDGQWDEDCYLSMLKLFCLLLSWTLSMTSDGCSMNLPLFQHASSTPTISPTEADLTTIQNQYSSTTDTDASSTQTISVTEADLTTIQNQYTSTADTLINNSSCECGRIYCTPVYSDESLREILIEIRRSLTIERKETKKYKLSLVSAEDNRISAVTIGYSGAFILSTFFLGLIISDLPNLKNMFKMIKTNLKG